MALGSNAQQQQQQQQQISRQVQQSSSSSLSSKPRLVKQKQSMCEEAEEAAGGDQPTDMRNLVRALPDFKRLHGGRSVFKQSSMNEELMSTERLREKERVRQNIQKQASLNEELMYRHRPGLGHGAPGTLDSLRDTLFSASAAKRFQLLKIGLTSKLKSSTTNIEKVAGTSLKNGFVRILQGWKQAGEPLAVSDRAGAAGGLPADVGTLCDGDVRPQTSCTSPASGPLAEAHEQRPAGGGGGGPFGRRHSREDGSDSSKDSSLQSDTSVDSEDSFASVIFVPKPDQFDPLGPKTPSPTLCTSAPASPQPSSLPGSLPSSPKVLLYSHSPVPSPTLPPNVPLSPRGVGSVGGPVGGAVGVAVLPPCSRAQQDTRLQQLKEALRQRNSEFPSSEATSVTEHRAPAG
ncbi:hypothetical protein ONE63_008972 [Megalurothrips usitatus]|uniref:Uncharacterized protein n=1 Tax=Megalurothrips usitatus TaxID=439358 RepID=A0AAV7XLL7_9NEOP|nr:hypothetical protein ONE63_008972 [Megalurothrips usitatus]